MFSHLTDAIRVPSGCLGGGIRLTSTQPMGPMRILKVRRGDVITAKAKGWYSAPASSNGGSGLQLWLQAVPDGNVPGQSETRQSLPSLRVGLTLNLPNGVPADAPKAYLQLQAYDEQGQTAGQQTRFVAQQNSCLSDLLIDDYRVEQDGYVRVYLASESDAPAFFDQLEINHQEALITQENHYSPAGLNLVGINKVGSPDHKYRFGGKEFQEDLGLNWSDFEARLLDGPRFTSIDPLAEKYYSISPYAYALNNPMRMIDPTGMAVEDIAGGVRYTGADAQSMFVQVQRQSTHNQMMGDFRQMNDGGERRGDDPKKRVTTNKSSSTKSEQATVSPTLPWWLLAGEMIGSGASWMAGGLIGALSMIVSGDTDHTQKREERAFKLYRGVSANHPDLPNALLGRAVPWGIKGGHKDPESHVGGNLYSIFTSWSLTRAEANTHALKEGPGGGVLEKEFYMTKEGVIPVTGAWFDDELEYLVPGIVTGAGVSYPHTKIK